MKEQTFGDDKNHNHDNRMMMDTDETILLLKQFFSSRAESFDVELAFLYGSVAHGRARADSDIDVAVMFRAALTDEEAFDKVTAISLELTTLLKGDVQTLAIVRDLTKPMLYYNAIVQGTLVYARDFTTYCDVRNAAMAQMEDFGIFGIKWQEQVLTRRLEELNHE